MRQDAVGCRAAAAMLSPTLFPCPPGRRSCVCGKLIHSRKGIRTRIQRELEGFPLEDSVLHRSWQTEVMS